MIRRIILILSLLQPAIGFSQNLNQTYWFFGQNSLGLFFDPISSIPSITTYNYTPFTNEGCCVLNNPIDGELLFYSDGIHAIDRNHNPMPNGSGLNGNVSTFGSGKIALHPDDCNKYYLFHCNTAIESNPNGSLYYSVIDLNLPGNGTLGSPLGDIITTEKNIQIVSGVAEGFEIAPEPGTRNYWLFVPKNSNSSLSVYHLTSAGISLSNTYNLISSLTDIRSLRISPSYNKIAVASLYEDEPTLMMDFNTSTGVISNQYAIPGTPMGSNSGWYGIFDMEWSEDGNKVYLSKYRSFSPATGGQLYQYDIQNAASPPVLIYQISNSTSNLGRGLRRGPDSKIYWIYHNTVTNNTQYIGAVNSPNNLGTLCDFQPVAIDMGQNLGGVHCFPRFLEFRNTIPSDTTLNISYNSQCSSPTDTTFQLTSFITDQENNNLVINSISADYGSATFNGDSITYSPTNLSQSEDNIVVQYCDDNCFPLCSTLHIHIQLESSNINQDIFSLNSVVCNGGSVILNTEIAGANFSWNTGATTPFIVVENTGDYVCTMSNTSGCVITDTISVQFTGNNLELIQDDYLEYCDVNSININALGINMNFLWSTGETTPSIAVNTSDIYFVTGTDLQGCQNTDSISIQLLNSPVASISPNAESLVLCENSVQILSVQNANNSDVLWSTGNQVNTITVEYPGEYSVTLSNSCGTDTDNITITPGQTPALQLPPDIIQCNSIDTLLSPLSNSDNYVWSTGSTAESIVINEAGTFWALSQNECGTAIDSTIVTLIQIPNDPLDASNILCLDNETWLVVDSIPNTSYEWSTGESNTTISANQGGEYSLTTTNICGVSFSSINLEPLFCEEAIYAPNSFTPDGDDINDVWQVYSLNVTKLKISIYNRWGDKIFESTEDKPYWTGNVHNGTYYAPDGIYNFRLDYLNKQGLPASKSGHITLIR